MSSIAVHGTAGRALAGDLVMLTKPRIISLLLVTTAAPMYIAGTPSWLDLLGDGGRVPRRRANASTCTSTATSTTAWRALPPIPGGRMSPTTVLAFGRPRGRRDLAFAQFINVLTAALALAGSISMSSIRAGSSFHALNIVIGGAARTSTPGGLGAARGIDLTAIFLFLIVFTGRPHFWALALLKQADYGRRRAHGRGVGNGRRWITCCGTPLVALTCCRDYGAFGAVYLWSARWAACARRRDRMRRSRPWTGRRWV